MLDEEPGDLRRKVRELEEARARLEAKDDERKRHIWMLEAKYKDANKAAKNSVAKIEALKEEVKKLKKDKVRRGSQLSEAMAEVKSLRQRMEKVEIDKALAESVKTGAGGSSSEAFFQDILHNFKELMETNLQCSICNELFIGAATVRCGHSFCEECIEEWRAKKETGRPNCPICRQDIHEVATNSTLDTYIEKAVDLFFPQEAKTARAALAAERKAKRDARRARAAAGVDAAGAPVAGPSHMGGRRRRRHPAGGRSGGSIRILLSRAPPSRLRGRRDLVHDDDTSSTDLDWTPRGGNTHNRLVPILSSLLKPIFMFPLI